LQYRPRRDLREDMTGFPVIFGSKGEAAYRDVVVMYFGKRDNDGL
jgi:hypothetical protein